MILTSWCFVEFRLLVKRLPEDDIDILEGLLKHLWQILIDNQVPIIRECETLLRTTDGDD